MNLHERGKRLTRMVTGSIGLVAVIGASALGFHEWADSAATGASANSPATAATESESTPGSAGTGTGSSESESSESEAGESEAPDAGVTDDGTSSDATTTDPQGPTVLPGTGGERHATSSGS